MSNRGEDVPPISHEEISQYFTSLENFQNISSKLYDTIACIATGEQIAPDILDDLRGNCVRSFGRYIEKTFRDHSEQDAIREIITLFLYDDSLRCDLFNQLAPQSVHAMDRLELERAIFSVMLSSYPDQMKLMTLIHMFSKTLYEDITAVLRVMSVHTTLAIITDTCNHSFCPAGTRAEYCSLTTSDDFTAVIAGFDSVLEHGDLMQSGYEYHHDGRTRIYSRSFRFLGCDDLSYLQHPVLTACHIEHAHDVATNSQIFELFLAFGANTSNDDSTAYSIMYTVMQEDNDRLQGFITEPQLSPGNLTVPASQDTTCRVMNRYDILQLYKVLESIEQHLEAEEISANA